MIFKILRIAFLGFVCMTFSNVKAQNSFELGGLEKGATTGEVRQDSLQRLKTTVDSLRKLKTERKEPKPEKKERSYLGMFIGVLIGSFLAVLVRKYLLKEQ